MASLSDIRRRIGSVKNTRQITRAMKLVAGAKLKRATDAALAAKPYQEALSTVLERVVQSAGDVPVTIKFRKGVDEGAEDEDQPEADQEDVDAS